MCAKIYTCNASVEPRAIELEHTKSVVTSTKSQVNLHMLEPRGEVAEVMLSNFTEDKARKFSSLETMKIFNCISFL